MRAAPSFDPSRAQPADLNGPSRATTRATQALARVRPFRLARLWLTVILVAWIGMLVGPEGWDPFALAALGIGFGGLLASRLPLPRRAEWALAWCMMVGFLGASMPAPTGIEPTAGLQILVIAVGVALVVVTLVAFCTAMQELARAAGAASSIDRWRRVLYWHIGALGTVSLLLLLSLPSATRTGPSSYEVTEPMGALLVLAVLGLFGAMIYAIVALVGLLLHLRRSFGLRGLVERGYFVLRQDAWGSVPAPRPFVYQATPPPWESSTTLASGATAPLLPAGVAPPQ